MLFSMASDGQALVSRICVGPSATFQTRALRPDLRCLPSDAVSTCRTLLNESDQRDLAEGIPLASSPAGRSTPLAERLLLARRSDLAPGEFTSYPLCHPVTEPNSAKEDLLKW